MVQEKKATPCGSGGVLLGAIVMVVLLTPPLLLPLSPPLWSFLFLLLLIAVFTLALRGTFLLLATLAERSSFHDSP